MHGRALRLCLIAKGSIFICGYIFENSIHYRTLRSFMSNRCVDSWLDNEGVPHTRPVDAERTLFPSVSHFVHCLLIELHGIQIVLHSNLYITCSSVNVRLHSSEQEVQLQLSEEADSTHLYNPSTPTPVRGMKHLRPRFIFAVCYPHRFSNVYTLNTLQARSSCSPSFPAWYTLGRPCKTTYILLERFSTTLRLERVTLERTCMWLWFLSLSLVITINRSETSLFYCNQFRRILDWQTATTIPLQEYKEQLLRSRGSKESRSWDNGQALDATESLTTLPVGKRNYHTKVEKLR